jgi:hypothetical protein
MNWFTPGHTAFSTYICVQYYNVLFSWGMPLFLRRLLDRVRSGFFPWAQASRTPIPLAQALQTQAPEIQAPETQSLQTQAPQTQAPQTQAPQTQAPQTQAPQTQAPQTQAPQTQAPQTQAPQTLAREIQAHQRQSSAAALLSGLRALPPGPDSSTCRCLTQEELLDFMTTLDSLPKRGGKASSK